MATRPLTLVLQPPEQQPSATASKSDAKPARHPKSKYATDEERKEAVSAYNRARWAALSPDERAAKTAARRERKRRQAAAMSDEEKEARRVANNEAARRQRAADPEHAREVRRAHRARPGVWEREKAQARARRDADLEAARAKEKAWRDANPALTKEYRARQRSKQTEAEREAARAVSRRWHHDNAERRKEYEREHLKNNRDAHNRRSRDWRAANPERERSNKRRWASANPAKIKAMDAAKRARRAEAAPPDEIAEAYLALIDLEPCSYCGGKGGHADHIVPLSRRRLAPDVAGGTNDWWNFAPACKSCNSSKHDWPLETYFAREHLRRVVDDGKAVADAWHATMLARFSWELANLAGTAAPPLTA